MESTVNEIIQKFILENSQKITERRTNLHLRKLKNVNIQTFL